MSKCPQKWVKDSEIDLLSRKKKQSMRKLIPTSFIFSTLTMAACIPSVPVTGFSGTSGDDENTTTVSTEHASTTSSDQEEGFSFGESESSEGSLTSESEGFDGLRVELNNKNGNAFVVDYGSDYIWLRIEGARCPIESGYHTCDVDLPGGDYIVGFEGVAGYVDPKPVPVHLGIVGAVARGDYIER